MCAKITMSTNQYFAHSKEKDHIKNLLLTLYAFTDVSNILEKYLIQTRGFLSPCCGNSWNIDGPIFTLTEATFVKIMSMNIHHKPCRWKPWKALSRSFRETYDQPDKCMTSSFSWSVDEQNLSTQSGKKEVIVFVPSSSMVFLYLLVTSK